MSRTRKYIELVIKSTLYNKRFTIKNLVIGWNNNWYRALYLLILPFKPLFSVGLIIPFGIMPSVVVYIIVSLSSKYASS